MTVARASWEAIPKVPTATAMASLKLLLAAVNDCVVATITQAAVAEPARNAYPRARSS